MYPYYYHHHHHYNYYYLYCYYHYQLIILLFKDGRTPLELAKINNRDDIVKLINERSKRDILERERPNLKTERLERERLERERLERESNFIQQLNAVANVNHDELVLCEILKRYRDMNVSIVLDSDGNNLIMKLCGTSKDYLSFSERAIDMVLKADHNININQQNCLGDTALIIACRQKHMSLVRLLLQFNAVVTVINNKGESASSLTKDENIKRLLRGEEVKEEVECADKGKVLAAGGGSSEQRTEVDLFLCDKKYHEHCAYFKVKGASTLQEFKDFFQELDRKELQEVYEALPPQMIFSLKNLLSKLTDDDITEYALRASSI